MANNDDKQKQVHDDKNISGPILHVLPHNAFKHPPNERLADELDSGMLELYLQQYIDQYVNQLGDNQLVVSNFAGDPAVLFRADDASCIHQAVNIAEEMKKDGQIMNCRANSSHKGFSGLLWLIDYVTLEDKDAKTKSKPLDDMVKEGET
ncbi:hypothetical protein FPANT_10290 [Fusarium pseudoanthophilum]|uniref:Uncharacterized protein n=1 Tax=Fusarium pseudoanthophilum TaxID=48495 RepID=A0A8H5NT00_9HYPO|nr:hypothetical protein FPANT_10290 [Fusarium pseudoanthophilum]